MIFEELSLKGAFLVSIEAHRDERGLFARTFCLDEFAARGIEAPIAQISISQNLRRGTLRGLHFQVEPYGEVKLVRCTRGAIYDVIVDLRPSSPTRGKWTAAELTAQNHCAIFVPRGFAHGFQTLEDDSEVLYNISPAYIPDAARGLRWNDPTFAIDWPHVEARIISARDEGLPLYRA